MSRWVRLWRALTQRRRFEHELDEELAFHLDERAGDLVRQGVEPGEARRRARIELGLVETHKSAVRAAHGLAPFDGFAGDLRHAVQALRRNPVFASTAVLILGLAIGANAALFAFFDTYVLQAPNVRAPERVVDVMAAYRDGQVAGLWTREEADGLEASAADAFEGVFRYHGVSVPLLGATPTMTYGLAVSANYLELLGAGVQRGRLFGADDVRAQSPVLVLSASGWRRLVHGDPDVVGKTLTLGPTAYTVVGVATEEFRGLEVVAPQYWIPRDLHGTAAGSADDTQLGGVLRAGVTPAQAQAALQPVLAERAASNDAPGPSGVVVAHRASLFDAVEASAVRTAAIPVFGGFLLVLLVACANLANLTLVRAAARRRELAIRLAVGASRWRIVRHMLVESALIASLAAVLGTALCAAAVGVLQRFAFGHLGALGPDLVPAAFDASRAAYVLLLALIATLAIGFAPALEASAQNVGTATRSAYAGGHVRTSRLRNGLLVAQIAASAVLLILASLIVANAQRADAFDPGFDASRIVDLRFPRPTERLLREIESVPGVRSATAVGRVPLSGAPYSLAVRVGTRDAGVAFNEVDERYFETLGVALLRGRTFAVGEGPSGARVAIVSAATARRLWPGEDALGRTFEVIVDAGELAAGRYEVVGVADDVASGLFIEGQDRTMFYFPTRAANAAAVLVAVSGDVRRVLRNLVDACTRVDAAVLCEPLTLADLVASQRVPLTVASVLASALGLAALLISCIGLYGVVAFLVAQRTREIGLRVALGATPRSIVRFVMSGAVRYVAIGLSIGLPICLGLSALIAANLEMVRAFDARSYVAMPVVLAAIALAAALQPARRAASVTPVEALREDG